MIFLLVVILAVFIIEPRRYTNIFVLAIVLLVELLYYTEKIFFNENFSDRILEMTSYAFVFAVIPFVMAMLSILTYFNSKILMEKEGRKKSNLFLGLIGVAINIVLVYYIVALGRLGDSVWSEIVFFYVFGLFVYFSMLYSATALYAVMYNWRPILYKPDYVIVLGSGLIGDRVPPLLASRIHKAVAQYKKYGERPLIVTSGGQGSDEKVSEAFAMKKFIHKHYPEIPDEAVVMEDQSTTTLENMKFSRVIVEERLGEKARGVFVSNNYHILRAGFYARKAGLKAQGVGARTAFYYVPNAFTREFIGLLEMYKWRHVVLIAGFTLFMLVVLRSQV